MNKKALVIVVCILLCLIVCVSVFGVGFKTKNGDKYAKYLETSADAEDWMPSLDEVGDYKGIMITRKRIANGLINSTHSVALMLEYSSEAFEAECERLNDEYKFISNGYECIEDYVAEVDGYEFRIVEGSLCTTTSTLGSRSWPKSCFLIGINHEQSKIAYLYHWDIELEEIEDLDAFVKRRYKLK